MDCCKSTASSLDVLPAAARRAKLKWKDAILPDETEYRNLRMVARSTTICDFEATLTCVNEDGTIYLQNPNVTLGAFPHLNAQIEAPYLLSTPKWQDTDWYPGTYVGFLSHVCK